MPLGMERPQPQPDSVCGPLMILVVFTSMWNNLIQNCDYGCDVDVPNYPGGTIPDNMITMRPVWSFSASLNLKF